MGTARAKDGKDQGAEEFFISDTREDSVGEGVMSDEGLRRASCGSFEDDGSFHTDGGGVPRCRRMPRYVNAGGTSLRCA